MNPLLSKLLFRNDHIPLPNIPPNRPKSPRLITPNLLSKCTFSAQITAIFCFAKCCQIAPRVDPKSHVPWTDRQDYSRRFAPPFRPVCLSMLCLWVCRLLVLRVQVVGATLLLPVHSELPTSILTSTVCSVRTEQAQSGGRDSSPPPPPSIYGASHLLCLSTRASQARPGGSKLPPAPFLGSSTPASKLACARASGLLGSSDTARSTSPSSFLASFLGSSGAWGCCFVRLVVCWPPAF